MSIFSNEGFALVMGMLSQAVVMAGGLLLVMQRIRTGLLLVVVAIGLPLISVLALKLFTYAAPVLIWIMVVLMAGAALVMLKRRVW